MSIDEITEDKLNLFIDKQLDNDEMDEIHQALFEDKTLRERVCQLKAVRELIGYAYNEVPPSRYDVVKQNKSPLNMMRAIAASVLLGIGVILGWSTYEYSPNAVNVISAENTFQYVANHVTVDHTQRKIVLHIDSNDSQVVNAALNEVDYLLATYRNAKAPLKLEVVTNKSGINILRSGKSPYINRIQKLTDDNNIAFFACKRSIDKASKKEGVEVVMMPNVAIHKTAIDIISDRLADGWVYFKA